MALELLKCPNCGAPMPPNAVGTVAVCAYCGRTVAGLPAAQHAPQSHVAQAQPAPPAAQGPAAQPAAAAQAPVARPAAQAAPAAQTAPAAKPVAQAPAPKVAAPVGKQAVVKTAPVAKVASPTKVAAPEGKRAIAKAAAVEEEEVWEWTEENVVAYAQETLGTRDSLWYEADIPAAKLKSARKVHRDALEADERVLALYDDTVFGSAEDGFIVTNNRFAWKNVADDPKNFLWEEIDPDTVEWTAESLKVMGDEVQITGDDAAGFYAALGEFVHEMAATAQNAEEEEE